MFIQQTGDSPRARSSLGSGVTVRDIKKENGSSEGVSTCVSCCSHLQKFVL